MYLRKDSGTWIKYRSWDTSPTFNWDTTQANVNSIYFVQIWMRRQGRNVALDAASPLMSFTLKPSNPNASCKTISIKKLIDTPVSRGTGVPIEVAYDCPDSVAEYLVYQPILKDGNTTWKIITGWTSAHTFQLDTTGQNVGQHYVQIWARTRGSTAPYEVATTIKYEVTANTCKSFKVVPSQTSPQIQSTDVYFFPESINCPGGGIPEYKIYHRPPSGTWESSSWSTKPGYHWNTTREPVGTHLFQVWVRAGESEATYDVVQIFTYEILPNTCVAPKVSFSRPSPQPYGTGLILSYSSNCQNTSVPTFKVYRKDPIAGWSLEKDWSEETSFGWQTTPTTTTGIHYFQVWVRAKGSLESYDDASPSIPYEIQTISNPEMIVFQQENYISKPPTEFSYMTSDSLGNIYVTGQFLGVKTFGPSTLRCSVTPIFAIGESYYCGYIGKIDKDGKKLWAYPIGGFYGPHSRSGPILTIDQQNQAYVAYTTFDGTYTGSSKVYTGFSEYTAIVIGKIDTQGNWLWTQKTSGFSSTVSVQSIAVDASGNTYIKGGALTDDVNFGGINFGVPYPNGYLDSFVAKLDSKGMWLWAKLPPTKQEPIGDKIVFNSQGELYLFGNKHISKMDVNGNWKWNNSFPSVEDVYMDNSDNIYVTGVTSSTVTLGNISLAAHPEKRAFVAKMDSTETWKWISSSGGTGRVSKSKIIPTSTGDLQIVLSYTNDNSSITVGTNSMTLSGVSVAKIAPTGIWQPNVLSFPFSISAAGSHSNGVWMYKNNFAITSNGLYVQGRYAGVPKVGSVLTLPTTTFDKEIFFIWRAPLL